MKKIEREYEGGLHLLKHKGKRGLLHIVFSRFGICFMLFCVQAVFMVLGYVWLSEYHIYIHTTNVVLGIVVILTMINTDMDPTAKITWLIIMTVAPLFGILLFFYIRSDVGHRALKKRVNALASDNDNLLPQDVAALEALRQQNPGAAALATYIRRTGSYPVFRDTDCSYYPLGDDMFPVLLQELEKAKEFIFLEFFIISEGLMWGKVLEVLARKAAEGVDVRVIYDGTCEFNNLPHDYPKRLKALGIKCRVFSPMTPFLSTHYNYRDHRKVVVVDGEVAFTGGVNLADEYINKFLRYGHWKDSAVCMRGAAARSFTLMFLEMWSIGIKNTDIGSFLDPKESTVYSDGFVIPFADCPLDNYKTGEMVYIDLLNRAKHTVHVMTPYLILDGELATAMKFAAQRGVDVVLLLPGVPDKKLPFALAKTHYKNLMAAGVRIYEYTPGFIHSKSMVIDGEEAVVGSINLDYRSLYHHFECAVYLVGVPCIEQAEEDFKATLKQSRRMTPGNTWHKWRWLRPFAFIMKALAPLF